jgi:hypothetical protein
MIEQRIGALMIADAFLVIRQDQIIALAAGYAIP